MAEQKQQIDDALRQHRWHSFLADVRGGWWVAVFVTALIAGASYWIATPRREVGHVFGAAVSAYAPASDTGRSPLHATVRLQSGDLVSVVLPTTAPYRATRFMELRVLRREWWPTTLSYQFVGYVDRAPNSALQTGRAE